MAKRTEPTNPRRLQRELLMRHQRQQVQAKIAYRRLVLRLARFELGQESQEPDPDESKIIIAAAGKTPENLHTEDNLGDVDRMIRRLQLVEVLEGESSIVRRIDETSRKFTEFIHRRDKEQREMRERHQREESALRSEETMLKMQKGACEQARQELWTLPRDLDDEKQEAAIHEEIADVQRVMYLRQKGCIDHATGINVDPSYIRLRDRLDSLKIRLQMIRAERTAAPDLDAEEEAALSELED
jgi:hypothetical protein